MVPSGNELHPSDVKGFIFSALAVPESKISKRLAHKRIVLILKFTYVRLNLYISVLATILVTNNNSFLSIKKTSNYLGTVYFSMLKLLA